MNKQSLELHQHISDEENYTVTFDRFEMEIIQTFCKQTLQENYQYLKQCTDYHEREYIQHEQRALKSIMDKITD